MDDDYNPFSQAAVHSQQPPRDDSNNSSISDDLPTCSMKHLSPQDAIDTFWDKFNSKTPGKASCVLPQNVYVKKASDSVPKGVVVGQNVVTGYDEAVELCKAKVEKIVKECKRINQKYRDPHFDIEFDLNTGNEISC